MTSLALLLFGVVLLLGGAVLFTNAVEWLGRELRLSHGAVGSILAAVGTALPESLIPVVAVISGASSGGEVAVGAIIGAPFLLATIALALIGASAFLFRGRRRQGASFGADVATFQRDLLYFLVLFATAIVLGLGTPQPVQLAGAVALLVAYAVYVRQTLRAHRREDDVQRLEPLYIDTTRRDPPSRLQILMQLGFALAAIVGGAHVFVEQVLHVAAQLGVSPLVLSLVLAPFATELPEKANSILWMRQGKDTLAVGNVTGAMVFQSALPVAIGLAFTDWKLQSPSLLAAGLAVVGALLAYHVVARRRRAGPFPIFVWAGLYGVFVAYVVTGV